METRTRYSMPELEKPLSQIHETDHIPGWCDGRIMERLRELAKDRQLVVNVGVWKGKSTAALAESCPGTIFAIDHFMGSPEERKTHHKQAADDPLSVYLEFIAYMNHFGFLGVNVIPISADSVWAAHYFQKDTIDLLFVDGGHDYGSVSDDLHAYIGRVKAGGIVCGDDYNWPGVGKAVDDFYRTYKTLYGLTLTIEVENKFWILEKAK